MIRAAMQENNAGMIPVRGPAAGDTLDSVRPLGPAPAGFQLLGKPLVGPDLETWNVS